MSKVIIFGTGQIAEIVHHYLTQDSKYKIAGFTADSKFIKEKTFLGLPLIPFETVEKTFSPKKYSMFIAMSYNKLNKVRASKYKEAKHKKYKLISYISSKSGIVGKIQIGDNCFILENQIIQPFAKIGNNVFVWGGVLLGHHSVIDDHSWLTSGVCIGGNAKIGSHCFLGMNATVGHMVSVGKENFIGANTLITKNTKEKSVFVIKDTEPFPLNCNQFLKITKMK